MNIENLKKLADFADTIPQEMFDMLNIRSGQKRTAICDSVGCLLGHATALFPEIAYKCNYGEGILFYDFSEIVFELDIYERNWLFSGLWQVVDNTPKGAAARVRYLIENGVPNSFVNLEMKYVGLYQKYITKDNG